MAPEFHFEISPEQNPLSEALATRAAANRQSLADRQQAKALEKNINLQATRAQQAQSTTSSPGARLRPGTTPFDELTASKKGGIKVLNLFMGNGPVHVDDTGHVTVWVERNPGFNNAYFDPGPENNQTYNNISTIYNRSLSVVSSELSAVTGNKVTNVFLHIIGSQYMNSSLGTASVELPEGTFTYYVLQNGGTTVADALPTDLTGISNIKKITMQANVTDVIGHLRTNGIEVDSYDCIFIQEGYVTAEPDVLMETVQVGDRFYAFTDWYTVEAPRVSFDYKFRSLLDPVIFDGDGIFEENEDPDSAPLANLLTQLNTTNTYVFNDEFTTGVGDTNALTYVPNAIALDYTTDNVTTVMANVKKRKNRLVSLTQFSNPFSIQGERDVQLLIGTEDPGDFTWTNGEPYSLPRNQRFEVNTPFFGTLALRLKYPITSTEVRTPNQTYLIGNPTNNFFEYVAKPVVTTESNPQPLYQNLLEAYSTYLYNVCIANPPLNNSASGFTSSTSYTYALDPNFDTGRLGSNYDLYYYPYVEYTVTSDMRTLYAAAMQPRHLRR